MLPTRYRRTPPKSDCGISIFFAAALGIVLHSASSAKAHDDHLSSAAAQLDGLVEQWQFRPHYTLPGRAAHAAASATARQRRVVKEFSRETLPLRLAGHDPTERRRDLLESGAVPRKAFSLEAWVNCHVNQPVGMVAVAGGPNSPEDSGWALAFHTLDGPDARIVVTFAQRDGGEPIELACESREDDGFKEYWRHVVLTFDGERARLYVNGWQQTDAEVPNFVMPDDARFEIAAYLENEPEMGLANLVSHARLYDRAIRLTEVEQRFAEFKHDLNRGIVYPGAFHFAAGPYLNYATRRSIRVLWETDAPATAKVEWGESSELNKSAVLPAPKAIQEFEITGLQPQTPYFYRVTAVNERGEEVSSGVLTFQTAVARDEPFRFVVIGDTETRPHINHALSERLWGERPNFVVVLGDLTDGGRQDAKWQWNHEYFAGVAGLCSRVPFYPVPGNGESDLYWYKRYHSLPGDESPYSFRYGNAEFFMLDSNLRGTEFHKEGRQYQWLDERLQTSAADWKFVCFHHAPFTSDEDDYGDAWNKISAHGDQDVRQLVPLFEQHGVDVVMFGHIHSYERSRRIKSLRASDHGVLYLLCGGGGGNLEDFAPNPVGFSSKVHRGHHYCLINIEGSDLELRMHDLGGAMLDVFRMEKRPD